MDLKLETSFITLENILFLWKKNFLFEGNGWKLETQNLVILVHIVWTAILIKSTIWSFSYESKHNIDRSIKQKEQIDSNILEKYMKATGDTKFEKFFKIQFLRMPFKLFQSFRVDILVKSVSF